MKEHPKIQALLKKLEIDPDRHQIDIDYNQATLMGKTNERIIDISIHIKPVPRWKFDLQDEIAILSYDGVSMIAISREQFDELKEAMS